MTSSIRPARDGTPRLGRGDSRPGPAETLPCLGSCAGKISHRDSLNVVHAANDVIPRSGQLPQPKTTGALGAIPQA